MDGWIGQAFGKGWAVRDPIIPSKEGLIAWWIAPGELEWFAYTSQFLDRSIPLDELRARFTPR